jgi:hypothetical protein
MRKIRLSVLLVLSAAVAVTVGSGAAAASKDNSSSDIVGHIYINDNTAPVNTVAGFDRHSDGTLTAIPGSPFVVGGAGPGHGDASQGALQLSADGRYLLAVDAGSNQISVLRIKPDGSLQIAQGSPVSSNGVNPVSIAVSGDLVYIANQGPGVNPGDTNYTGFTLNAGGHLTPLPGSTYPLPSSSLPGEVVFSSDGSKLVGTRILDSAIDSFTVGAHGVLTPAPGSPFFAQSFTPTQGYGQLGSVFSPTNAGQLFVTDAHVAPPSNGPAPGLVSSFADAANGILTPIGTSPFSNDGTASCWVEISHDGAFLFVVNTGSATVSTYSIAANGSIAFMGSTGGIGAGAEDARLSPDGATLWVVDSGTDGVSGFTVNGGALTPLATTPGPAGATPTGIVLT